MAFNPFNWFRKNQKVIFAVMTIIIMFVFIGSFGRGDFFDWLTNRVGGRASGETVATLYGKPVRESDLSRVKSNRKLANDFLFANAIEKHGDRCKSILDNDLPDGQGANKLLGLREVVKDTQQRAMGGLFSRPREKMLTDLRNVERLAANVRDNQEQLTLLGDVATMIGFQVWLTNSDRQFQEFQNYIISGMQTGNRNRVYPSSLFLGGSVGGPTETEELLDFLVWRQQADKLGVTLTTQDIMSQVNGEAGGFPLFEPGARFETHRAVTEFLKTQRGGTPKDLLDGLRDEFRVVLARAVLLAEEPGARSFRQVTGAVFSPSLATPDEFYNFFREQRTMLNVKLLRLPVAGFFDQVKDNPSDEELRTRFERYKDTEPTPLGRDPGFKEPRRLQVEYLYASPADPHYAGKAKARLLAWAAGLVASPSSIEAGAMAFGDPITRAYELDRLSGESNWYYNPRDTGPFLEEQLKKIHYTSILRPEAVRWLVGSLAAPTPFVGVSNLYGVGTVEEINVSRKFSLIQLLANADPANLLANASLIAAALPEPASLKVMEPQVLSTLEKRLAMDEMDRNLRKVAEEMGKLKSKPKEIKDYVTKAAKEHHLTYSGLPEVMTIDAVETALRKDKDIGLKPLRQALSESYRMERPRQVADFLFSDRSPLFYPQGARTFLPKEQHFLFWKSQDLPPRTRDFSTVRSEVETAWKLQQARRKAIAEAERLESEINKGKLSAEAAVALLKQQKRGEVFELEDVSQLVAPMQPLAMARTEYRPFLVPEDKQQYLEYPPADFAKQLMTLTRPGQSTVIVDQPGREVYVAVLVKREEPTMEQFRAVYSKTPDNDTLYSIFRTQRRIEYTRSVMEQLRRDAAKADDLTKDGRFKIPDAFRRDGLSRDEDFGG